MPITVYPNLTVKDGNHRLWALYNDGYDKAEVLMYTGNKKPLTESYSKEEIIKVLKDKFEATVSLPPRCFILPDGTYLSTIKDGTIYEPHYYTDSWLYQNGYIDKDKEWEYYTIRELGCITCNGFGEFYCILPVNRPTDAQLNSLGKWLDKYYYDDGYSYYHEEFKVVIPKTTNLRNGEVAEARYNPKETTVDELIKKVRRYYISGYLEEKLNLINKAHVSNLNEDLLLEKSRNELIRKSQQGANYKTDQSKGKNRWERKKYSKVANFVREFNSIDMNTFFKKDILNIIIPVHGETDDYKVKIKFNGVLDELRRIVKANNNVLDYKSIMQSLTRTFNAKDVYVWCSCPDHKYRFDYWCTIQDYNSGKPQLEPTDETNPGDSLGAACKHVNLVLSNLFWLMKVASVINNYIHFAEENMQRQFAEIIFPKVYGVPYPRAVQIGLFDRMYLKHSKGVIDAINAKSGKKGYFQKKEVPQEEPEQEIKVDKPFKQPSIFNKEFEVEEKPNTEIQIKEPVEQPKFAPNVKEQPKFTSKPKQLTIFDDEEITEK